MSRAWLALLMLGLVLTGCGRPVEEFGGPTMGSRYSLKYLAGGGVPERARLKAEVEAILAEVDAQLSAWRSDSWVSRFNQLPAGACAAAPATVRALVRFGAELAERSEGAFDLTVEPLRELWGFGPQSRGERVPSAQEIAAARTQIGYRQLRLEGERLCKATALQLDFDSIAAGHAVERIATRLEALGVDSYLLDVTGELKVRGRKADGSPWRVAIEAPRDDRREAQRVLALDGYGLSTSGDYRNYFEVDGRRYSHTLDPRSGAPVAHDLASVTVVDRSALVADGLSTLLMVLGPQRGLAFAEEQGIAALFVRRGADGFVTEASEAFRRLEAGAVP